MLGTKRNACEQFWFSRDLFSVLLSNLTVKECFALLPGLSRWHRSFLNGECSNISFLREWMKSNHGYFAITRSHYSIAHSMIRSMDKLIDLIFDTLEECHTKSTDQLRLSRMVHHFYEYNLYNTDTNYQSVIRLMSVIQSDIIADLSKCCANQSERLRLRLNLHSSELRPDSEPFIPFAVDILGSPPLFDLNHSGSSFIKKLCSELMLKVAMKIPNECIEMRAVRALKRTLDTTKSDDVFIHCAHGLLRLFPVLWDGQPHQIVTDTLDLITQKMKYEGCLAFESTIDEFDVLCRSDSLSKVLYNDIEAMLRFCMAVVNDCRPGGMFETIVNCLYVVSSTLMKGNMEKFMESRMFECLVQLKFSWDPIQISVDARILGLIALVYEYGTESEFDRIQKMFPAISLIKCIMKHGRPDEIDWTWFFEHCIAVLLDNEEIFMEFMKDRKLVAKLLDMGSVIKVKRLDNLRLAEIVLRLCLNIVRNGTPKHISRMIKEGIWEFFGDWINVSDFTSVDPIIFDNVYALIDVIDECGAKVDQSYKHAIEYCRTNGISDFMYGYCRKLFVASLSSGSIPVRLKDYPFLTKHFPRVEDVILYS